MPARAVVTPGDPAGIGPYVMYRAWIELGAPEDVAFAGPARVWYDVATATGGPLPGILLDDADAPVPPAAGQPDARGAEIAWRALDAAIEYGRETGAALVTGPISKEHMLGIGFPYAGHTEYLRARFDVPDVLMVMAAGRFAVGLATVHVPLRRVPDLITAGSIAQALQLLDHYLDCVDADAALPISVAGLNPHAGEQGALGSEETEISRGIEQARPRLSRAVTGPLPGDTVFRDLHLGRVGAVLAMYHDQGLAPFKLLYFNRGVNVTVGLPVLRTSPDHGTAYALAGRQGISTGSARAALDLALRSGDRCWLPDHGRTQER